MSDVQSWEVALEVADPVEIDPWTVIDKEGKSGFQQLMLAFAVAYNDLKDLMVLQVWLALPYATLDQSTVSSRQMAGMIMHLTRLTCGTLHELLVLIDNFAAVANGDEMAKVIAHLPERSQGQWKELLAVAMSKRSRHGSDFAKKLLWIRNNLSHHYFQPKEIVAAYRAKHSANLPTDPRRAALISKGANMMETRFHFADGAVEQAMLKIAGTHGPERFGLDLGDLIEQVNNVMFQVLTAHIGLRDAQFRGAVWTGP